MGVPGHDERDYAFALKYGLPIKCVIRTPAGDTVPEPWKPAYAEYGTCINSGKYDGLGYQAAVDAIASGPEGEGPGREAGAVASARLGHLAPALLGLPDPDRALRGLRRRAGAGRGSAGEAARAPGARWHRQPAGEDAGVLRDEVPLVRQAGQARDRHHGHVRGLVVVLRALRLPGQRPGDAGCAREVLDAGGPVHRRHRARDPAPALLALLRARDEGGGPARRGGALHQPAHPGHGARRVLLRRDARGPARVDQSGRRGSDARRQGQDRRGEERATVAW